VGRVEQTEISTFDWNSDCGHVAAWVSHDSICRSSGHERLFRLSGREETSGQVVRCVRQNGPLAKPLSPS
jgi:hypothetical protein